MSHRPIIIYFSFKKNRNGKGVNEAKKEVNGFSLYLAGFQVSIRETFGIKSLGTNIRALKRKLYPWAVPESWLAKSMESSSGH